MSGRPAVSVILCAYSDARFGVLLESLASVAAQTVAPAETIVAVDHNPALAERLRAARPGVRVLENEGPRGLSSARNTALAAAQGEVVAFLDDDAVADPAWLEHLLAPYRRHEVLAVGGRIVARWPERRPAWFPDEFDWVVGCSYRGLPDEERPVRNVTGASMSFRREALVALGGFCTTLGRRGDDGFGCEETEACIALRARYPGSEVVYAPASVVRHVIDPPRARGRYFLRRCFAEGRSKAALTGVSGADAVSTERAYVASTLPRGIVRGLRAAVSGRDPAGALRAAAIVGGLAVTVTGYGVGRVRAALDRTALGAGGECP